ncbi:MAG: Holliday junction resolvase RuvX [Chloroflexi bacterium]|nr:Holliday junction resolvase RuvX [Chloroflexota bacterium]
MSAILSLDVGDERIGVAISDETLTRARPLAVIRRVSGRASYLQLLELINIHAVERIVVGWPLLPDGSEGKQVRSVQAYLNGLAVYTSLPVVCWDERLSTSEASELLRAGGGSRKRQASRLDAAAAAVILQQYLDERNERLREP